MAISPLTNEIVAAYWGNYTPYGNAEEFIVLHHGATTSLRGIANTFTVPGREASTHYAVGAGYIFNMLDEVHRSWNCGNVLGNGSGISIECVNSTGGEADWQVAPETIETLCYLVADIARRHGWTELNYYRIRQHKEFSPTYCSGHVWDYAEYIIARSNQILWGKDKPVPAFSTSGPLTKDNNLFYSVHVANLGQSPAVHDGADAGSIGFALRLEALNIDTRRVPGLKLKARGHVEGIGWTDWVDVNHDTIIGTKGKSKRLEALEIDVVENTTGMTLVGQAHVQNYGWSKFARLGKGAVLGTTGKGLRMECLRFFLI
jgi:hypothetical protein